MSLKQTHKPSNSRLKDVEQLLKFAPYGIFLIDLTGDIIAANEIGAERLGKSVQSIIGTKLRDYFPEPIAEHRRKKGLEAIQSKKPVSFEDKVDDRWYQNTICPIFDDEGKVNRMAVYGADITEQKKTQDNLRLSEEKYREFAESLPQVIFETDDQGNLIFVNKNAFELFGYSKGEFEKGLNALQMIIPEEREKAAINIEKIMNGESLEGVEYTAQKKDGNTFPVAIHSNLVIRDDRPAGIRGIVIDLTDRHRAQEERLRLITAIDQADETIVVTDTNGTIVYVNPAFEKTTGYSVQETIGENPQILKSGKQSEGFYQDLWDTISEGKVWYGHFTNKKKDGSLYEEEASISPVKDHSGQIVSYVAVKRDVTQELQLRNQLLQAQKMEALGTLAGGIAHDFNNILSIIVGNADLAIYDTPEWNPVHENLLEIQKACLRARDLVRQILTFSRRSEQQLEPLKIGSIVKESLKFLRSSTPSTIEIRQNIASESDTVNADPTQIHQLILNLSTNAVHAMGDEGGVLTISLEGVEIDNEALQQYPDLMPGKHVKLTVSDTGHGIQPEDVDRIFDPFFTTKKVGEGTGMGLSVAHGIVKKHQGAISIDTEMEKGTSFNILFPVIEGDIKPEFEAERILPTGQERILFVDDEKAIVDNAQLMLERLGYHVTPRTSSIEALEAFRHKYNEFDLVITDMTMPNMTGKELAKELMTIRSDIPVILCTGFSEQIDERRADEMGISAFVMKPIIMREIANTIRKVLDEKD